MKTAIRSTHSGPVEPAPDRGTVLRTGTSSTAALRPRERQAAAKDGVAASPRMLAQRRQLQAVFGEAVQLERGAEEDELQMMASPGVLQREGVGGAAVVQRAGEPAVAATIAHEIRKAIRQQHVAYVAKGLGGGGAGRLTRSSEVRHFRAELKRAAREQAYADVSEASGARGAATAETDYQQMIGGNRAYENVKATIDEQMLIEAERIVAAHGGEYWDVWQAAYEATLGALLAGEARAAAKKAGAAAAAGLAGQIRAELKDDKNRVVGKGEHAVDVGADHGLTPKGRSVRMHTVHRVWDQEVGRRSLDEAIAAPDMGRGLRILGGLIDNAVPGVGEVIDLSAQFTIPTPTPGLVVVIILKGTAARGVNGATTAGVTTLGNPKRMELMAKFSVGVGADAIGLKSSATVGFFVRSGSDSGTEAAMQALSYGAYRAAPAPMANLWAPDDKARPGRSNEQRAEMWAAMVERKLFVEGAGSDTYADLGLGVDGGFGVNLGVAKLDLAAGEALFARYDEKSMRASLGADLGARVPNLEKALDRRRKATAEKKASFGASLGIKVNILNQGVDFSLSASGSDMSNWGVEITAGISMPSGAVASTTADRVINGWVSGLGELLKKLHDATQKHADAEPTGVWGLLAQMPADAATVFDAGTANAVREAIRNLSITTTAAPGFDTALGQAPSALTSTASTLAVGSSLVFALTFGMSNGEFVVRFELRSRRSIDIGGGTPVLFSGAKTTRLLALGREGRRSVGEAAGMRLDD